MSESLSSSRSLLIGLTKTDPCPQVRHRAHHVAYAVADIEATLARL